MSGLKATSLNISILIKVLIEKNIISKEEYKQIAKEYVDNNENLSNEDKEEILDIIINRLETATKENKEVV